MATTTKPGDGHIILFSNSKSGGGKGKKVLDALAEEIGPNNCYDLGADPHPEKILASDACVRAATSDAGLRILVCGGDGTMTWIMAAVDIARERRMLDASAKYYVAMMPLGTGNDLARTFGWGGAFRQACLKPAYVEAARTAAPVSLDRWLVSVMPSAAVQKAKANVPEIFSVHEFSSEIKDAKEVVSHKTVHAGRHHSKCMTAASVANLAQHDAEMRTKERGVSLASSGRRSSGSRGYDSEAFDAAVREEGSFGDDDRARALVGEHVRPSESVLKLGGSWRSYDGTFSNYFSLGVDAEAAHAFHAARRANPKRFSSPQKNQLLYAWLGACATGGLCGCAGPPLPLASAVRVLARIEGGDGWDEIGLPRGCRGLIVLNLRSYAGGRDLWGPPSCCRDSASCASADAAAMAAAPPAHDDGVLEVVTVDGVFSMGCTLAKTNGLGGRARRLVRCKELRLTATRETFMQVDGEPWLQPPATVHLKCIGQSTVLQRA
eukprot:CAMPEP_0119266614 /NCGR_PEP_ID=MMETSP1329-20130426/5042_1 /TAXON_ID=114041 /ORGANISM="Genus nov. species nov., Strain RCC1024" /LENGTH=492 /DNA_ID=CAMNT_0007266503 /DNA_START=111 /DNA_END=1586 /DNA_ORIENTATION=+